MRLFFPCVLLAACSDYAVNSTDKQGGGTFDSGDFNPPVDDSSDTQATHDTTADTCPDVDIPGDTIAQNDECYVEADPVGTFTPILKWKKDSFTVQSGSMDVMMMPAVGSLNDDDGDGDADADDTPDVVFITYGSQNCIRAVSGDGSGTELFSVCDNKIQGQGGVALGDLDGDGWTDVVAATTSGVAAYHHDGTKFWTSASLAGHIYGTSDNPAISDMDGDGHPEVIMGSAILNYDGSLAGEGNKGMAGVNGNNVGTTSVAVDIDGDGVQEVVVGNALYRKDGSTIWTNGETDGYVAVGNFDADAKGEIVVSANGKVRLQDDDGTVLCRANIPGAGTTYYGGPPTIADFDGDGEPEFALAAGSKYSVFEKDCSVKWQADTQDASSGNTGSAVFDFEGDGAAEAVYADETRLWVFDGATGAVKLESKQHSNGTWLEYPVIADVDGDGHAEIIVANTSSYRGIYVFGDADDSWRPGRKIWNEHAYSITNVDDDGSIPKKADQNWLTYNNFRSGDLDAATGGYIGPDLITNVEDVCTAECDDDMLRVWVSVANQGYSDVTDPVELALWLVHKDGSEEELATQTVTSTIPAAQRLSAVEFDISPIPHGVDHLYAAVDGGNDATTSAVDECDEENNTGEYHENLCPE